MLPLTSGSSAVRTQRRPPRNFSARSPRAERALRSDITRLRDSRRVTCLSAMQDPMPLGRYARLPLAEVTVRASRSSGPGGQHANVTASRIEAVFDVESSEALSDAQKRRIIAKLGPRVTAIAQDARSQAQN